MLKSYHQCTLDNCIKCPDLLPYRRITVRCMCFVALVSRAYNRYFVSRCNPPSPPINVFIHCGPPESVQAHPGNRETLQVIHWLNPHLVSLASEKPDELEAHVEPAPMATVQESLTIQLKVFVYGLLLKCELGYITCIVTLFGVIYILLHKQSACSETFHI